MLSAPSRRFLMRKEGLIIYWGVECCLGGCNEAKLMESNNKTVFTLHQFHTERFVDESESLDLI